MAKVRKAVITAAGRGTRQYPASTAVQKELFSLVDRDGLTKPVIQIIVEEALDSGIEQICLVTQPGEEKLYRDYFRRMNDEESKRFRDKDWAILESERLGSLGERLSFAEQHTPDGFGHAVFQAKSFVGDEPFRKANASRPVETIDPIIDHRRTLVSGLRYASRGGIAFTGVARPFSLTTASNHSQPFLTFDKSC